MASVARADLDHGSSNLAAYYADTGTPPGVFLGAGLAVLVDGSGIAEGSRVSEEALFRMLGMLQDPVTGRQLGRMPASNAVAGFDLTFSVPKSVSVAWALADPATREVIEVAHHRALRDTLTYGEQQVFASRTGRNGIVSKQVRGVVAAGFDHWDSRAGDPQLHTHLVVLNRAQTADGQWRTLDSKALFKAAVGMSELYNGLLADQLTAALGWNWAPLARAHSARVKWEVEGIPESLCRTFSQRSLAITTSKDDLIARFVALRHRSPTSDEVIKLRQLATLNTREAKQHHSLTDLTRSWINRAGELLDKPCDLTGSLAGRNHLPLQTHDQIDPVLLHQLSRIALDEVADKRATFTRGNVLAEVHRQLQGIRFATAGDRITAADTVTEQALTYALSIGTPRLEPDFRDRVLYTTQRILDAETRLLEAGRDTTAPVANPQSAVLEGTLSAEQTAAITDIATSGRRVDVLIGAAGTGKTTTMAGLRTTWEATHGPGSVVGLAPSAVAAEVLGGELGISADNTAKWLTEHARHRQRRGQIKHCQELEKQHRHPINQRRTDQHIRRMKAELDQWSMHQNQLIVLDEASLAGTLTLDHLRRQAIQAGAKLLLVGDFAQLDSVTAGGAFHLLTTDRPRPPTLSDVRRFDADWERTASLQLRAGDPTVIRTYSAHGRIYDGDDALDQLYQAWKTDIDNGLNSIMIATDHDTVRDLNHRAHLEKYDPESSNWIHVVTAAGETIRIGDRVITRRNNRNLSTGSTWVKNGDTWTVKSINPAGHVTIQRADAQATVTLPAEYTADHLDLGYAITVHQAQGRTVDTAHAAVADTTNREQLYVMTTRGRTANHLYLNPTDETDLPAGEVQHKVNDPLRKAIARTGRGDTATEVIRATTTPRAGGNSIPPQHPSSRPPRINMDAPTTGLAPPL